MRYLVIGIMLAMSGCVYGQKLEVGECIGLRGSIYKVVAVGTHSVKLVSVDGVNIGLTKSEIHKVEKYDCFDSFDKEKK